MRNITYPTYDQLLYTAGQTSECYVDRGPADRQEHWNGYDSGRHPNRRRKEVPQAEEDLSKTCFPIRTSIRDHCSGMREDAGGGTLCC